MTTRSFSGGAALEAKLREISKKVDKSSVLRVGFLENSTYPDGTSIPQIAAIQEFGAPGAGIPSRPFFRTMIEQKSPSWGKILGNLVVSNNYNADIALGLMGEGIKDQLQQSIVDFNGVPLAPATISAKGNSKQLVDTGVMLASVKAEVK